MNQHIKTTDSIIGSIIIWLLLLCVALTTARAATITVTNTNDSGVGSLRQAIADAHNGDSVDFGVTGTITLTTGELVVDKSVTINGPGAVNLAVNSNRTSRVFHISSGTTVTIAGLTITNGSAPAPYYYGGGIYNDHATLTVNNCTISGNSATLDGGGLCNDGYGGSATLTVNDSTLSGNSGQQGGGIFNRGFLGAAMLTVNNSTLSGNSGGNVGGGIFNLGNVGTAMLTVNNSTLSGNSASSGGGITNVSGNGSAPLTINNSTFSGNSANFGGGILNDGSYGSAPLTIGDTVLSAGASGGNIYNSGGTVTSLGYNLSNDDGGGFLTATGDQINADPMLGPLQDNGGPTFTHALLTGSPAIDAGDPNFDPYVFDPPMLYDQRGSAYSRVAHGRVDIGAFEVQTVTPAYAAYVQPPINPDGSSTFNVRRGVVPVKFTLSQGGVATCDLPPATIAVTRTAGGMIGQVNESVYSGNADTGSNFRIDSCQYVYNLNARSLGVGTYRVDILINGQVVGSATFGLN